MLALIGIALAAPRFIADVPADAALARAAWDAATACAGWEAPAHPVVRIERGNVPKGFLGLATADARGLARIELDPSEARIAEVIVHEVAHAWVRRGPTALVEGRAELLADCMVLQHPGLAPLQWDDGRALVAMPDLRSWDSQDDHGPSVNPFMRTDAYLGAGRLVRLAALILPERALWPERDAVDWLDLDAMLADAGQPGELLRQVLRADAETQRRALSDEDQDGLPEVGERMFGTDPTRFDTDGDGWWDGAEVPVGVLPLPFDGTPVCSGWATGPDGGSASLRVGGNLRGWPAPVPGLRAGSARVDARHAEIGPHTSVLVGLEGDPSVVSGGLWARVDGSGLVPDTACVDDDRFVVWAADPRWRDEVPRFAEALRDALSRADDRLGEAPQRLAVALGGRGTTVEGSTVRIADLELSRGSRDLLARQAVAMRRVWDSSPTVRDWRDVEALARRLALPVEPQD